MADKKISALTGASTPLAGTEVLPIVQSNATVKVAVDNLTVKNIRSNATSGILQVTGPAAASTRVATVPDANFTVARIDAAQSFTGDQTLSTGNLIVSNGKGIDFSDTPGTGTSELLNDYEEGTWTPVLTTTGTTFTSVTYDAAVYGLYTKIGNVVFIQGMMRTDAVNATGATGLPIISGLPFTASTGSGFRDVPISISRVEAFVTNNPSSAAVFENTTQIYIQYRTTSNGAETYLPLAAIGTGADNNIIYFAGTYTAA
jgi:hypothetical protein